LPGRIPASIPSTIVETQSVLKDLGMAKMLHCRIRYFTDGAVIGSK
jgi:hypothetical protein